MKTEIYLKINEELYLTEDQIIEFIASCNKDLREIIDDEEKFDFAAMNYYAKSIEEATEWLIEIRIQKIAFWYEELH